MPRVKLVFASLAAQNAPLLWAGFRLTSRVAEPAVTARHLRFSSNGVTAQGLGGRSEATGAGNQVLVSAYLKTHIPPRMCHMAE